MNIIENARYGAAKSSAIEYKEASEKAHLLYMMGNKNSTIKESCTALNATLTCGDKVLNLDVKGSLPSKGTVEFSKEGDVQSITDLLINGYVFNYSNGIWTGDKGEEGEVTPPKEEGREATEADFGSYVNYEPDDATWDSSKLSSYGVSETVDGTQGTFNIYDNATNTSAKVKDKSQSITCYKSGYDNKYNGWRVLDVSSSGQITLIHAGTPECYYHASGQASASVKILETASTSSSPGDSKAWTKYGNNTYATSVHYMTNEDYNKITYQINKNNNYTIDDYGSGNSSCYSNTKSTQCGYNHDMIDIGSYYWLASTYNTRDLYHWEPGLWCVISFSGGGYSVGVRPVIVLKSTVKIKSGTGSSSSPYTLTT